MKLQKKIYQPYKILIGLYIIFILYAIIFDSPTEIFTGLKNIIFSPDILITDYVAVGGIGASLINAALTSLLCIALLIISNVVPNGSTIMAVVVVTGFSFLGKNILNIWPIIFGVYLYSRYQKERFATYTLVALLGTALSPIVSQFVFLEGFPPTLAIIFGIIIGTLAGFILPPIASHGVKAHNGYNLYNVGFAAGLVGTLFMCIFRSFGIKFETRLLWYTGSNIPFIVFLFIISIYLIIIGFIFSKDIKDNLTGITNQSGRLVNDFYTSHGNSIYINMGLLGIFSTIFMTVIGANINGATVCGVLTIVGFGCFGKNLRNVPPVMIGALIGSILHVNEVNSPALTLAILFSTCLAPIAGKFGWKLGVLAGIIHISIVTNVGPLHGGLNLYNNGFAGGIVAMILIPLITSFKKESN